MFKEYSREISKYLEKIALSDLTHIIVDHGAISMNLPRTDSGYSIEKDFN